MTTFVSFVKETTHILERFIVLNFANLFWDFKLGNWTMQVWLDMSEIGAVVKVTGSHLCGWGSILDKSCSFLIVCLRVYPDTSCSDQNVKYWMPRGFPFTSLLLFHYHVKQYIHQLTYILLLSFSNVTKMVIDSQPDIAAYSNFYILM